MICSSSSISKAIEQTTNTGSLFIALPKGMQGKHMLHEMCTPILFLSSSSPLDGFSNPKFFFFQTVESPSELVATDTRFNASALSSELHSCGGAL